MGWRTIETAPRDGFVVLGWIGFAWPIAFAEIDVDVDRKRWFRKVNKGTQRAKAWVTTIPINGEWVRFCMRTAHEEPTHWMPLPNPPQ